MSNNVVGNVYAAIIEKVIVASQNDFEEYGIDQRTLLAMKESWQQRLSSFKTASFPWDPTPVPAMGNPPTLPSNGKTNDSPIPNPASLNANGGYAASNAKREAGIKPDSPSTYQPYNAPPGLNTDIAQRRAQGLIQQRQELMNRQGYPPQGMPHMPGQPIPGQQRPGPPAMPYSGQPQPQYRPPQPPPPPPPPQQQQQQQQQQMQQQPRFKHEQLDGGADEYEEGSSISHGVTDEQRLAADTTIRQQVEAQARFTDSGLFAPLSELKRSKGKQRAAAAVAGPSQAVAIPQLDGDYDAEDTKEENPEDAINSDLDDSDDEDQNGREGEEEGSGHALDTMLCTYDKVQRVKNKWKATLKDGIICTNGKDYLFHKANGEFEW